MSCILCITKDENNNRCFSEKPAEEFKGEFLKVIKRKIKDLVEFSEYPQDPNLMSVKFTLDNKGRIFAIFCHEEPVHLKLKIESKKEDPNYTDKGAFLRLEATTLAEKSLTGGGISALLDGRLDHFYVNGKEEYVNKLGNKKDAYIEQIVTIDELQRNGLGRELLLYFMDLCYKNTDFKKISLKAMTPETNVPIYESFGFKVATNNNPDAKTKQERKPGETYKAYRDRITEKAIREEDLVYMQLVKDLYNDIINNLGTSNLSENPKTMKEYAELRAIQKHQQILEAASPETLKLIDEMNSEIADYIEQMRTRVSYKSPAKRK